MCDWEKFFKVHHLRLLLQLPGCSGQEKSCLPQRACLYNEAKRMPVSYTRQSSLPWC